MRDFLTKKELLKMSKKRVKAALGIMLLINTLVLLWSVLGYGITYEVDDDVSMAAILAGAYGESSPYIVYGNIIYGYILQLFYQIPGNFLNWLVIIHYGMMYLAYNAIGYVLIKRLGPVKGSLFFYSFEAAFCYGTYLIYTFTRVSGFTIAAAYVLLFYSMVTEERDRWAAAFLGIFLAIYGSFSRFMPFFMISAFAAGGWLYLGVKSWKEPSARLSFLKKSIPFFIMALCVFGGQLFSDYMYQNNEGWKEYLEYNELRSALLDYGVPDYERNRKEYQEMGISENDYYSLCNWDFADPEKFSKETLENILALEETESVFREQTAEIWKNCLVWAVSYPAIYVWILLLYVWAVGRRRIIAVWIVLVGLGEIFYLQMIGRAPDRVTFIICLGMALGLLALAERESWERIPAWANRVGIAGVLGAAVIVTPIRPSDLARRAVYYNRVDVLGWFQDLQNTDNLYLWDVREYRLLLDSYGVLMAMNPGISDNSVCLGGWLVESPIRNAILEAHGVSNSFQALLTDPDVFLAGSHNIQSKLQYLRENYEESANYSIYETGVSTIYAFAYNFENVRQGNAAFLLLDAGRDGETDCLILEGWTDVQDADHYFVQLTNESGVRYTFQARETEGSEGQNFLLQIPLSNMTLDQKISATLIIEKDGIYEYGEAACTFSWSNGAEEE